MKNTGWNIPYMKRVVMALAAAFIAQFAAHAAPAPKPDTSQYKVLIGTGQPGGTYDVMSKELMGMCAKGNTFGLTNTDGTIANIDGILSNQLDAGIGQEDSLFLKKSTNPDVRQLKTLFTLAPEEVHVFVLKNTGLFGKKSVLGVSMQGDPITFTSADQLSGYKIAAWGGSRDTARLVGAKAGINWEIVPAANLGDALKKLNSHEVQGILAVAGAPVQNFQEVPQGNVKLVGFSDNAIMKLVDVYNGGAILNYSNLDAEGVKTVSTNAILFTREYTDPEMLHDLAEFRACFQQAAPKLKDMRGKHKKWRSVNVNEKGKWTWYDLPTQATVAAAPTKRK